MSVVLHITLQPLSISQACTDLVDLQLDEKIDGPLSGYCKLNTRVRRHAP